MKKNKKNWGRGPWPPPATCILRHCLMNLGFIGVSWFKFSYVTISYFNPLLTSCICFNK